MTPEQIKTAAVMLCAAYWRGKLEGAGLAGNPTTEEMIKVAAEREWEGWCGSARALLSMAS